MIDEDGNKITECFCDPCDSPECSCYGNKCAWCLEQED